MNNVKVNRLVFTVVLNLVVGSIGILIAYPLVWMVSASFKDTSEIFQFPPTIIPDQATLANYARLFKDWPFWSWYGNSLIVAGIVAPSVLFFTFPAGVCFAPYPFSGPGGQVVSF